MPKRLTAEHRAKIGDANRRRIVSEETKAKMSAAKMGRKLSPEHRDKMAAALKARYADPAVPRPSGELNHNWRGDDIGYRAAHLRAGGSLPSVCALADDSCVGHLEVALRHDRPSPFFRTNPTTGCLYSTRPEDYMRLCHSHHARFDAKKKQSANA